MKIKVNGLDYTYTFLERASELAFQQARSAEGDQWKGNLDQTDPELSQIMKNQGLTYPPARLSPPLHGAGFAVYRRGNFYAAAISITPDDPNAFNRTSEGFNKALLAANIGAEFTSLTPNLVGHIIKNKKGVAASVTDDHGDPRQGLQRTIAIGTFGSESRPFGKKEDFVMDVGGELVRYANILLQAVYEPYKDNKSYSISDIEITLNP